MKTIEYTIQDPLGIHARPAGMLTKQAAGFKSSITLDTGSKKADAKRIMAVMSLGVKQGTDLQIIVEGEDEQEASEAMEAFLKQNL